ncbi:hypothetical protein RFI_27750 [Reticulomyxa filosa]|uniref:COMM domain-containing protein n=1 Tax=Reticulomyxa filosa TaxID=46433 RepID=X6M6K9_RETFI|nr:hypothetical protein RFI_27750 [Reticulomyxa filosa]|eukprot:ETO09628.1 hypothetical protein RFI_27750 [Reticulomyxa filosa]
MFVLATLKLLFFGGKKKKQHKLLRARQYQTLNLNLQREGHNHFLKNPNKQVTRIAKKKKEMDLMEEKIDLVPLSQLTNAPDKETIKRTFQEAFRCRTSGLSDIRKQQWGRNFNIEKEEDVDRLFTSILSLIKIMLYNSISDPVKLMELFPKDDANFHEKLKQLIVKTCISNYNYWRTAAVNTTVSTVPKLVDFEWRLDIKQSSNNVSYMSVPAVLVSMQVQEPEQRIGILAPTSQIQFELSKESLEVMLNGLNRIKDELKKF